MQLSGRAALLRTPANGNIIQRVQDSAVKILLSCMHLDAWMPAAQGRGYFMSLVKLPYNSGPIAPQSNKIRALEKAGSAPKLAFVYQDIVKTHLIKMAFIYCLRTNLLNLNLNFLHFNYFSQLTCGIFIFFYLLSKNLIA